MLVALYGLGLVLSNPLVAFGLFYAVFAVWIGFGYWAGRVAARAGRGVVTALWTFIAVWIAAIVPAFFFASLLEEVLWITGTVGTIVSASFLLDRTLLPAGRGRHQRCARYGRAAGVATGLLLPRAFLVDLLALPPGEAHVVFLTYLPFLVLLVPAILSIAWFALSLRESHPAPIPAG